MGQYIWLAFLLILAYLIFVNRQGFEGAIKGLAGANVATIGALQGKNVQVGGSSGFKVG